MPTFDPAKWNDGGEIQYNNNCYDYATDRRSGRKEGRSGSRPGKKAGKEMRKSPYTCDDIMNGVDADVKAAGTGEKSDKDKKCNKDCWKVAVMRAQIDSEKTDFHFVRQDSDGSWSHKQGAGPAKKTDDDDHDIKDPEKAKIDDYKICGYFCFCSGMQVAMLVPAGPRQPYATVVLKEPGLLTSKSMDLELPAGRLTLLYEDKVAQPHATVSAEIFSGEANPVWNLRADDINAIASMLRDLPRSERRPVYRINYQGFNFENSYEQLPSHMQVLEGLISFREGDKISWFEDIHGLEKWLMRYALKQALEPAERALLSEAAKKVLDQ